MVVAVFVRTLKQGVTYEQFKDAWMPETVAGEYPARTMIARSTSNERQVITILELDMSLDQFGVVAGSLTRPDALERLEEVVESTELEGVYEEVFGPDTFS